MKKSISIRSGKDRLRFTCLFEILLIVILTPVGALVFEKQILDVGLLAIVLSLKAMVFNYIYNWYFDRHDVRAGRVPTERTFPRRIIHAVGFEVGLVFTSLPVVVWWLGLTVMQALLMDITISSFVVIYTLLFTWGYDRLFPVLQVAPGRSQ